MAVRIRLNGFEQLSVICRFDPNICTFYRFPFYVRDDPLNS